MFTGIIQTTGQIQKIMRNRLIIDSKIAPKLKPGGSIAVDGICLTVTERKGKIFSADVMPETLKKTTLGKRRAGDRVNLEFPLPATGCFEGHIVSGHVEGTGKVTKIQKRGNSYLFTFQIPKSLTRYVVPKGSIAINGVSLTVIRTFDSSIRNRFAIDSQSIRNQFVVGIIPHTFRHTNFQTLKVGDKVNVETDVMAKYFLRKR